MLALTSPYHGPGKTQKRRSRVSPDAACFEAVSPGADPNALHDSERQSQKQATRHDHSYGFSYGRTSVRDRGVSFTESKIELPKELVKWLDIPKKSSFLRWIVNVGKLGFVYSFWVNTGIMSVPVTQGLRERVVSQMTATGTVSTLLLVVSLECYTSPPLNMQEGLAKQIYLGFMYLACWVMLSFTLVILTAWLPMYESTRDEFMELRLVQHQSSQKIFALVFQIGIWLMAFAILISPWTMHTTEWALIYSCSGLVVMTTVILLSSTAVRQLSPVLAAHMGLLWRKSDYDNAVQEVQRIKECLQRDREGNDLEDEDSGVVGGDCSKYDVNYKDQPKSLPSLEELLVAKGCPFNVQEGAGSMVLQQLRSAGCESTEQLLHFVSVHAAQVGAPSRPASCALPLQTLVGMKPFHALQLAELLQPYLDSETQ